MKNAKAEQSVPEFMTGLRRQILIQSNLGDLLFNCPISGF